MKVRTIEVTPLINYKEWYMYDYISKTETTLPEDVKTFDRVIRHMNICYNAFVSIIEYNSDNTVKVMYFTAIG